MNSQSLALNSTVASRKTPPAASTPLGTAAAAIAAMKFEARQLKNEAGLSDMVQSHCAALESVARAWGYRNWNEAVWDLRAREDRA